MTPPPIVLLQVFNFAVGLGSFLAALNAIAAWNRVGWSESTIGILTTLGMVCYAGLVGIGGRLSDGWGRAKVAALGAGLAALGCAVAAVHATGITALVAAMAGFAGSALFFPGNVGLFSDAQAPEGKAHLPLHVKISRYNLGWSAGNLAGFVGYGFLDRQPIWVGFAIAAIAFSVPTLWMCRWLHLPASVPQAEGDRAPHPALARLTRIGRVALMIACLLTMAQITMLQTTLQKQGLDGVAAQAWAGRTLMVYSTCYVVMFLVFGWWGGWILRPWRLFTLQLSFVVGVVGYLLLAQGETIQPVLLTVCGGFLGIGFAGAYISSIYYSLRLPHGAARAAALHETFLGIGNTCGPVLAGWALGAWNTHSGQPPIAGLGLWMGLLAVVLVVWHLLMVPKAARLCAGDPACEPEVVAAAS